MYSLLQDRYLVLPDSSLLLHHKRFDKLLEQCQHSNHQNDNNNNKEMKMVNSHTILFEDGLRVRRIDPSFRIIAVGLLPENCVGNERRWLSEELLHSFCFHRVSRNSVGIDQILEKSLYLQLNDRYRTVFFSFFYFRFWKIANWNYQ